MPKCELFVVGWLLPVGCFLLGCAAPSTPPATTGPRVELPADFHRQIRQVYNFESHTLDEAQREEKSGRLDQFWDSARQRPDFYVPALRKELADFANPPFFLFDGSRLLLELSRDAGDGRIVLAAVAHCDLRDIQPPEYFRLVHHQAVAGEDTTAAAMHILENPHFSVLVPQHAMKLDQDFCLIYMLFPTNPDFWIRPAIVRLQVESDVTAQKSLLQLLWYAQTPESAKAIGDFSHDATRPAESRAYVDELLKREKNVSADWLHLTTRFTTEESLRQARRDRMKSVSDEALLDFDRYTARIIEKRK